MASEIKAIYLKDGRVLALNDEPRDGIGSILDIKFVPHEYRISTLRSLLVIQQSDVSIVEYTPSGRAA